MPVLISFLVWPPLEPLSPSLASLTARFPSARAPRAWGAAASKPQVAFCLWWSLESCIPPRAFQGIIQNRAGREVLSCNVHSDGLVMAACWAALTRTRVLISDVCPDHLLPVFSEKTAGDAQMRRPFALTPCSPPTWSLPRLLPTLMLLSRRRLVMSRCLFHGGCSGISQPICYEAR